MIFSSVFFGAAVALMVNVFPFLRVLDFGTPVSFVVFTFVTVTVTIVFMFPYFTVIFSLPGFFPVITPLVMNVATALLEEL